MHEFEQYHESLVAFCKRLKISSGMADRAEITEGETHVEFLYNLLKREIELRDQAKIDGLIKDARFPVEYSFNQFRTDEVEFPEECTLDTLESLQFLREHKNVRCTPKSRVCKAWYNACRLEVHHVKNKLQQTVQIDGGKRSIAA